MGFTDDNQEGETHGICDRCLARELEALAAENGGSYEIRGSERAA
jgi:hypothetical protein